MKARWVGGGGEGLAEWEHSDGAVSAAVGTVACPEKDPFVFYSLTPLYPGFTNQQAPLCQGDPRVPEDRAALLQADPRHDAAQRAGDERASGRGVEGAAVLRCWGGVGVGPELDRPWL